MTPQSWDQVKSIFGAAIEQEPQYREAYARAACQGDEALLREVLSLLSADSPDTRLRNPFLQPQQTPLLKERYRIERELGRGGLGLVYLARDESLHGRRVVIKMPLNLSPEDPWLSDKFAAEVKALALIHHPGVVGALDSGATPDGRPSLVMQYVEGQSLRESIPEGGAPLPFAGEALRQIGHALGAAHARGIWHRDLKPANIMQQPLETGRIHLSLIDFGIASVTGPNVASGSTRIAGTPPYMSPEQLQGRVGAACDIFAMGVIAFELVTGRKPFAADDPVTLHQLHSAGAPNPAQWRPELPPEAARLILAALAFRPDDRPGSAADYGEALAGALTARRRQPLCRRPCCAPRSWLAPSGFGCSAGRRGVVDLAGKPGGSGISWSLMVQPGGSGAASAVSPGAPAHVGRFLSGGARSRRISLFIKRRPCRGLSQRAGVIRTQGRRTEPHTRRAPLQVRRTGQTEPVVHLVAAHRRGTRRPGEVAQRAGPRCDGRFRRTEAHPAVCEFPAPRRPDVAWNFACGRGHGRLADRRGGSMTRICERLRV